MRNTLLRLTRLVLLLLAAGVTVLAQQGASPGPISNQELIDGLKADGANWLTFGGDYSNHRYSPLTQITPENVAKLQPLWTFQTNTLGNFETTTLLRDNVLYVTDLRTSPGQWMRAAVARSGDIGANSRRTSRPAAASSTAGLPRSANACSWSRSTPICSRWT